MDKVIGEDELRGLEEEIESAVDRLFVDKRAESLEAIAKDAEPPAKEQPFRMEKDFDFEQPRQPVRSPAVSETAVATPSPALQLLEKMEEQLLSLEWEINKENLSKAKEEVLALREILKEKVQARSVLNLMDKVLDHMVRNEEKIQPPLVKFLMDSKETLKLLMREEGGEIDVYKQLALTGIQARYSGFEEFKEIKPPPVVPNLGEEMEKAAILLRMESQLGELSKQVHLLAGRLEELYQRTELLSSKLDQNLATAGQLTLGIRSIPVNLIVFKVEERLFGVESEKAYKLFKVPAERLDRYVDRQKLRLKDVELRLVDLRKVFSISRDSSLAEGRILAVMEDGEYKGLMIDQVVQTLTTQMESGGDYGNYFMGIARWTYQNRPAEISILDLKKL